MGKGDLLVLLGASIVIYAVGQEGGPVCFSCPRTLNPEECRTSVTCTSQEVCSVQEVLAPHGDVYFWSGCESIGTCQDLSESSSLETIIGKRQTSLNTQHCVYCCQADLCNNNCTPFVNLALHKPAYQSSLAWNGTADRAVDGNTDGEYFTGLSCTHTASEPYTWWAVDLQNDYHITKVKLYERTDANADGRSIHLQVLVSSYNATDIDRTSKLFTLCGEYFGHSSEGNEITVKCPTNTNGRWVRIQQNNPRREYMHLCEVEVFGF